MAWFASDTANTTVIYLTGQLGSAGLAGYAPAIIALAAGLLFLGAFVFSSSTLQRFTRLRMFFKWLANSCLYFGFGLCALALITGPGYVIYWLAQQTASGNTIPLKWLLYIIGGYFGIAGLGWLFKKYIVDKIQLYMQVDNKDNKQKVKKCAMNS
jgi:hypothetical protein